MYTKYTAIFITLLAGICSARTVLEEHISHYFDQGRTSHTVKTKINGRIFAERADITQNGVVNDWSVDGQQVDGQAYQQAQSQALAAEIAAQQKVVTELLQEELAFKQRIESTDITRILRKALELCRKKLAFIAEQGLEKHLTFTQETFNNRAAYDQLTQTTLPEAEKLLAESANTTKEQLATIQKTLVDAAVRLHKLVNRTIEAAMTQSDDTQMLKRLVEISSTPSEDTQLLKELVQA
jgi:hypothetical protein